MNKKSRPTLRDVSRLAGVGTTTVSRVINGGEHVKAATMERVQAVIEKLSFQPNQVARMLKGESAKSIGIVVPSISDPFFSTLAGAAQQVAREKGYIVIIVSSDGDTSTECSEVKILSRHSIDGLLIAPSYPLNVKMLSVLRTLGKPVVAFDRPLQESFSHVVTDNRRSASLAVQHLIQHGHTRIACISAESILPTIQQRVQGYRDAMRRSGLTSFICDGVTSEESAQGVIAELMQSADPPTALFTTKNLTTMLTFAVLQSRGYAIPKDVALIGFDDFDMASLLFPAITVVRQPISEIGKQAATLLFESFATTRKRRSSQVVIKSELCIRASCGCS